ncbi:DUF3841 domain-containing protein [Ktedonosporobacter rubrisoli]|uniref:DUF3841 domain-containing protein n=1 Tax=Ktedonosporobacter rubrisoli TaxID=2509675 RepID=UPI0013EE7643|nr:DUF3841 domain-containing protein [Ktedonosporobacter rubrisoli]
MHVWMTARAVLWEQLQQEKLLYFDQQRIPGISSPHATIYDRMMLRAYDWMRQQMAQRLSRYQGHYPWWAWVQWKEERAKPDLRSRDPELHYLPADELAVRLELLLPAEDVLCSHFYAWCNALSNEYVSRTEAEAQQYKRLDPAQNRQELIERSWEAVFDLDSQHWDEYRCGGWRIQGVFEELRIEQVKEVTYFRPRSSYSASL